MRFFFASQIDDVHVLDADEAKHVGRVLRAKVGDLLALTDGKGHVYEGEIEQLGKRTCVLKTKLVETQAAVSPALTLVIAPTKSTDRFEWLLEKAMELGVRTIQPVWTERSERRLEKSDRWKRVLISALKQSQQSWLVDLRPACSWDTWISDAPASGFIAHCDVGERQPLFQALVPQQDTWIAIGPEGDFTGEEIKSALDHGAVAVSLGNNRLRTETAGLVAIQTFVLAQDV
jgi:16S rRNA (uracil1498-N3)-methyltransferase